MFLKPFDSGIGIHGIQIPGLIGWYDFVGQPAGFYIVKYDPVTALNGQCPAIGGDSTVKGMVFKFRTAIIDLFPCRVYYAVIGHHDRLPAN